MQGLRQLTRHICPDILAESVQITVFQTIKANEFSINFWQLRLFNLNDGYCKLRLFAGQIGIAILFGES